MKTRKSLGLFARVAAFMLFACASLANASMGLDQEHQLKAAFIANFIKFIEWPDLGDPGSKFVVGVYGADDFEHSVEDALAGRSVSGHPIVVEQLRSDAEMRHCRMVVSGASSEERIDRLSRICENSGTVLVGEADDFAKFGGAIGLRVLSSHIRFDVNLSAARRAKVTVSSKLLSLAREVFQDGP